jgi:hypothetical protein
MRTTMRMSVSLAFAVLAAMPTSAQENAGKVETKQIAEEAFIYGFPLVMNYAVFYDYFIDRSAAGYKAPLNTLYNSANVYTPADKTIVTPNSDTPYSFVGMDLRAEPLVICNPEIEKSRYFSVQLIDFYTFNFGYMGSRTTGNGAACGMIAGPSWKGEKPEGIAKVFQSETEFGIAGFRTQLFNPADIDNVRKIQAGYRAMPLSKFLNKPAPPAAPEIAWPKIDTKLAASDPVTYLNFVLQFCPATGPAEVEVPLRARFAKIGVEAGKPFAVTPEQKAELEAAMKSGIEKIKEKVATLGSEANGWRVTLNGFGDRQAYNGDWLLRAAAAMAGIYGNSPSEAVYPLLATDSTGNKPDTSTNRYTLTFPEGGLPPVEAFWSVTMYDGKTQLLIVNPINRYLINSPMIPDLKKNSDGSITLHIQKDSPGADKESNWLPAPDGPAYVVMRLYWPKADSPSVYNGTWKPPPVQRAQ